MSVLCANGCHVYRVGASACTCGQNLTKFPLSGGVIPNYAPNPYSPPRPPTPPTAGEAPAVGIIQFKAAKRSGGSHLSADGERVYCVRYGQTFEAGWNAQAREYGAWGPVGEIPGNAAAI